MVATYRQQSDPTLARMAQPRNFGTPPFERALRILGNRGIRAGAITAHRVDWNMRKIGYGEVSDRTVRWWNRRDPDLPERLIRMGEAQPGDFPQWAREFLQPPEDRASMAQDSPESSRTTVQTVAVVAFVGWSIYQIARAIFSGTDSTSRSSQPLPSRRRGLGRLNRRNARQP